MMNATENSRALVPGAAFRDAANGNSSLARPLAIKADDELDGSTFSLRPSDIAVYERNPRTGRSPIHDDLKKSILEQGFNGSIPVTRRPGRTGYITAAGFGTRLRILHELASEYPEDERFKHVPVQFRKWRGEAAALAAHGAENEQRADIPFADKARLLVELRAALQSETGTLLSSADIQSKAESLGFRISRQSILLYDWTIKHLPSVMTWVSYTGAQAIKKRYTEIGTLWQRIDVLAAGSLPSVLQEELAPYESRLKECSGIESTPELDADAVCRALTARTAVCLGLNSADDISVMLTLLKENPKITADQLRHGVAERARLLAGSLAANQPPPSADSPSNQKLLDEQIPLTRILASVPGNTPDAHGAGDPHVGSNSPAIDATRSSATDAANSNRDQARRTGTGCEQAASAARAFAELTGTGDYFFLSPTMPLGYYMELPADASLSMEPKRLLLWQAGFHLLMLLSTQADTRTCTSGAIPRDSRWMQAIEAGTLGARLCMCGIAVTQSGGLLLPADRLYCVLTEHQKLAPAFLAVLRQVAAVHAATPNPLAIWMDPVTRAEAAGAASSGS